MSSGGEGGGMHFPSEAGLTNGIALGRRREGNASGQTIRDELLNVCQVVMAKVFSQSWRSSRPVVIAQAASEAGIVVPSM